MVRKKEGSSKENEVHTPFSVLWDLDGVIADTRDLHLHTWKVTFDEVGILLDTSDFQSLFGKSTPQIIREMLGESISPDEVKKIGDRKEEIFRELVPDWVKLFPGVVDTLDGFRRLGTKQAIASSAPIENIEQLVDALNIRQYFQALISGHHLPSKPAPDVFLRAADELGAIPSNCVVFEDAVAGVEAAKQAGALCVAVTTTNPPEALGRADLILTGLDAIPFEELFAQIKHIIDTSEIRS